MFKSSSVIILCLLVASCASRPAKIAPVYVSSSEYADLTCEETHAELSAAEERLAALSKRQNSAATTDAFSVLLLGVPVANLTGNDVEGDLALEKGRVEALKRAVTTACSDTQRQDRDTPAV